MAHFHNMSTKLFLAAVIMAAATAGNAGAASQVTNWGMLDPGCIDEHAVCADDPAFTPGSGGYRAGGSVAWTFNFDPSAFASISSITMDVLVVGFWDVYPGNIDEGSGQTGNYFAIDGVPFAPFLGMTDGRDLRTFALPTSLSAGWHTFSVVAYEPPGPNYEGWAGIDVATLTIEGPSALVPEPETYAMLLAGLGLLGFAARRRKQQEATTA
jgi:hypothetical protein